VTKVWVIEQGEYSDYRVVGVFSSYENAKLIADAINGYDGSSDDAEIREWDMDPAVSEIRKGLKRYFIHMERNGDVVRCDPQSVSTYSLVNKFYVWRRSTAPAYIGQNKSDLLDATVWARDGKHAVKIANEKRSQMIADGEWK
jgi:hypothetical protein